MLHRLIRDSGTGASHISNTVRNPATSSSAAAWFRAWQKRIAESCRFASKTVPVKTLVEMERWKGRVALVTGASIGIGAAVTRALVQHGMRVVGCARNVDKIEKLAAECESAGYSGTLIPYKCDLSNEEEILSMFSAIKTLHKGVDVCINNAGLAHNEPLLSGKTEGWRNMIDVNVLALSICTREAYKSMKERDVDDGHIININSMSGHRLVPSADEHFYCATKYAVTALTEGIRQELREEKTHIRATCISPGIVETEFAFRHHNSDPEKAAAVYESIKCLKAEDIASAITFVLSAPPHVQIGDVQMRPVEQVL
ncbi:dehydrogenase/reductase SDR family member 11a [Anableps anableps]